MIFFKTFFCILKLVIYPRHLKETAKKLPDFKFVKLRNVFFLWKHKYLFISKTYLKIFVCSGYLIKIYLG